MIILIQNQANDVVVTVTEKTTVSAPHYLFRFVNDTSKKEYTCIRSNSSGYTERYDEFLITVISPVINPLLGEVELDGPGYYHYYIYAQTSATNLDYTQANELVEVGKMNLLQPAAQAPGFSNPDNSTAGFNG